jgi:competence protein ComGC
MQKLLIIQRVERKMVEFLTVMILIETILLIVVISHVIKLNTKVDDSLHEVWSEMDRLDYISKK